LIRTPANHVPYLQVIAALGLYYGEVIYHHYENASWMEFEGKDLSKVAIEIQSEQLHTIIYPLVTMNNFWKFRKEALTESFQKILDQYQGRKRGKI
jgi:hypothetical protein